MKYRSSNIPKISLSNTPVYMSIKNNDHGQISHHVISILEQKYTFTQNKQFKQKIHLKYQKRVLEIIVPKMGTLAVTVRFGYKIWMMCSSNGYIPIILKFTVARTQIEPHPRLGSHVVNTIHQPITGNENHVVFFNNFFTSHRLLVELAGRNIRACGTVRENRTSKCPLMTNKVIQKKEQGFYD